MMAPLAVLALAACSLSDAPVEADVAGDWRLVEGTHAAEAIRPVEGFPVTISLGEDGTLGISPGCNQGGGSYDLVDGHLVLGPELAFTEMACQPPVMATEAAFLAAIEAVTTAAKDDDELILSGDDVRLVFEEVSPVELAALSGRWRVQAIAGVVAEGEPWLEFDESGVFTGFTGCRDLDGLFVLGGDSLHFTQLAAHGECPGELAGQDGEIVSVIERPTIVISGDSLSMTGHGGPELVATRS